MKSGKCVLLNDVSVADERNVSAEHWWNDTGGEKGKYFEEKKTLPQLQIVHQKSHNNRPGFEP